MITHIAISVVAVIAGLLMLGTYGAVIGSYMQTHAAAIGKDAEAAAATGWQKVLLKLKGWKTLILAWFASVFGFIAAIPGDVYKDWAQLPFGILVDQHVAAMVTIVLTLIAGLTHAQGIASAAQTPPQS